MYLRLSNGRPRNLQCSIETKGIGFNAARGQFARTRLAIESFNKKVLWPNTLSSCSFCESRLFLLHWDDILALLLDLTQQQKNALRPLTSFQGASERGQGGFRRHTELVNRWKPKLRSFPSKCKSGHSVRFST